MKYTHLLFDFDGMLVDTLEGVLYSAKYALDYFGIKVKNLSELKPFLGPPLRDSFSKRYGLKDEQCDKAIEKYRECYKKCCNEKSKLNDGIYEALPKLKEHGYTLAVATSKYEKTAADMLESFGIKKYFDVISGSNLDESVSKKSEVIEQALKRLGIENEREKALMIGDMKFDDIGAKEAHIDSLGVYTGTAKENEHEQAGATYIARSINDMTEFLLSMK